MHFAGFLRGSNLGAEFRLQGHFRLQSSEGRISTSAPNLGFKNIIGFSR